MKRLLILLAVFLSSCSMPPSGIDEFLGLKFGIALKHPIKEGPRKPPVFHGDLNEFYQIEFPNQEFSFVGVATVKNNPSDNKEQVFYSKEGAIWGAYFSQDKTDCGRADYDKLVAYIEKNYKAKIIKQDFSQEQIGNTLLKQIYTTMVADYVGFDIACVNGAFGHKTLVIRDYSVLRKYANEKGQELIDKAIENAKALQKRKIE